MWQKKNPYLEYMIALLRGQKEGIQLGDSEIRGPKTSEPASEGKSSGSQRHGCNPRTEIGSLVRTDAGICVYIVMSK